MMSFERVHERLLAWLSFPLSRQSGGHAGRIAAFSVHAAIMPHLLLFFIDPFGKGTKENPC